MTKISLETIHEIDGQIYSKMVNKEGTETGREHDWIPITLE